MRKEIYQVRSSFYWGRSHAFLRRRLQLGGFLYFQFIVFAGKRKFDGGNQNQGDPKRRYQSNWTNQTSGAAGGVNGGAADAQWYQDSYASSWQ